MKIEPCRNAVEGGPCVKENEDFARDDEFFNRANEDE